MKRLLIMGGYGNVGRILASYLAEYIPEVQITLAGRNLSKAKAAAETLNNHKTAPAVACRRLDAADKTTLLEAFSDADMVIVASSSIQHVKNVVEAALATNTDYFDVQLSSPKKIHVLQRYKQAIEAKELVFITDGGYHPGIPGAMINWARQQLGTLTSANIYAALRLDWSAYRYTPSTTKEMLEEFKSFDPKYFEGGEWKTVKWSDMPKWDFGEPYGELRCTPMLMEEIRYAPSHVKELQDTGFFISGFNPVLDYLLMPIILMGVHVLPPSLYGPLGRLFQWGLKLGKPPFGVQLTADCHGEQGALQLSIAHHDGYEITVIPIVACLRQYFAHLIPAGLHLHAWVVEPEMFFTDLAKMGAKVEVRDERAAQYLNEDKLVDFH